MKNYLKGKIAIVTVSICIILIIVSLTAFKARAEEPEKDYGNKYYTSITLETGDTLTSIANKYRCEAYGSAQEYIEEIMNINGLTNDSISAGQSLIIVYYQ